MVGTGVSGDAALLDLLDIGISMERRQLPNVSNARRHALHWPRHVEA
jgi:hypothetical protein